MSRQACTRPSVQAELDLHTTADLHTTVETWIEKDSCVCARVCVLVKIEYILLNTLKGLNEYTWSITLMR